MSDSDPQSAFGQWTEEAGFGPWDVDDYDADAQHCDCGAEVDSCSTHWLECAICHWLGCSECMVDWDDVYPELCSECARQLGG